MISSINLGFLVKWNQILSFQLKHNFFWVFVGVLVLKVLMASFLFWLTACDSPDRVLQFLATSSGDHASYIEPIHNFFSKGSYYFNNAWGEKVYVGRIPMYGLIYYILNVLTLGHGFTALALAQITLEAYAICYMAYYLATKKELAQVGLLFLILMVVSANQTFWSTKIQPESFSTSLLILLAILFDQVKFSNRHIWKTGLLLLILTSFKPYFGVLYILFGVKLLLSKEGLRTKIFKSVKLAIPLFVFLLIWAGRNYQVTGKPILFTEKYSGYAYPESEIAMRKLGASTGLSWVPWDPKNFGHFMSHEHSAFNLPEFLKHEAIHDSLLAIKSDYIAFRECCERNTVLDQSLTTRIRNFQQTIRKSAPFQIQVMGPVRHFASLTIHSGAWFYPLALRDRTCGSIISDLDKGAQSLLYYFGLLLFIPGCLMMYRSGAPSLSVYILFNTGFLIVFFPFVIKYTEYRYFIQSYPLLLLAGAYFCNKIWRRLNFSPRP